MSQILASWLSSILGSRVKIEATKLESLFSNGYLLGDLLVRLGVPLDYDQFQNQSSPEAKVANFSLLVPALAQTLQISLTNRLANEIITEQRGAVEHLLLQIKERFDTKAKAPKNARPDSQQAKKQPTETDEIPRIAEKIKKSDPRVTFDGVDPSTRKYLEHGKQNEHHAKKMEEEQEHKDIEMRDSRRQELLESMTETRHFAKEWDQKNRKAHIEANQAKIERDKSLVRGQLSHDRYLEKMKAQHHEEVIRETEAELGNFEKTLKRIVADDQEEAAEVVKATQARNAYDHIEDLKKRLPSAKDMAEETGLYMEKVKEKKQVEMVARQEREKRRRKIMLEQIKAQNDLERKGQEELLLAKLLKISAFERNDTYRLMRERRAKVIETNNRVYRSQQYKDHLANERRINMEQDAIIGRQIREENQEYLRLEHQQFVEADMMREAAKFRKHYDICRSVSLHLVDLTMKIIDFKEQNGTHIPMPTLREWVSSFVSGTPLYKSSTIKQVISQTDFAETPDPTEFDDYINHRNEWSAIEPEQPNEALGAVLQHIELIVNPPPKPPEPPKPPPFPLRGSIVGKALSGKTFCSLLLSKEYVLVVINEETVSAECLMIAELAEKTPQDPALGKYSVERIRLAQLFVKEKTAGTISDQTWVSVIHQIIIATDSDSTKGGWVLDGFPQNANQARLLEKCLTGLDFGAEDKKKGKKPSRTEVSPASKATKKTKNSTSAPVPIAPTVPITPMLSGLDYVIKLDNTVEIAIQRANARKRDPETGLIYHDVLNPAPPEVAERLQEMKNYSDEKALIDTLINQTQEELSIVDWFTKFGNMTSINTASQPVEVFQSCKSVMERILAKKQRDMEESTANLAEAKPEGAADSSAALPMSRSPLANPVKSSSPNGRGSAQTPTESEPKSMSVDTAVLLRQRWDQIQAEYQTQMIDRLNQIQKEREFVMKQIVDMKKEFVEYLASPNPVAEIVSIFEKEFNAVSEEKRKLPGTKKVLENNLAQLQEELWDSAEQRKEEAEAEGKRVMSAGWFEKYLHKATNHYGYLIQLETDRYQTTLNLIDDYQLAKIDKPLRTHPLHLPYDVFEGNYKHDKGFKKIQDRSRVDISSPQSIGEQRHRQHTLTKTNEQEISVIESTKSSSRVSRVLSMGSEMESESKLQPTTPVEKCIAVLESAQENAFTIISSLNSEDIESQQAVALEGNAFRQRIESLVRVSVDILVRAAKIWDEIEDKFEMWSGKRYMEEMKLARKLVQTTQKAIDSSASLPMDYGLGDPVIDVPESEFVVEPKRTVVLPTTVSEANPAKFSTEQIARLSQHIRTISPTGVLKTVDFVSLLHRLANSQNAADLFPTNWCGLDKDSLSAVASLHDPFKTGYLDWREFFVMQLVASFPTAAELNAMKAEFMKIDSGYTGVVDEQGFRKVRLWFEVDEPSASKQSFMGVKDMLFFLFHDSTEDGLSVLDYTRLLLYLAVDSDAKTGLEKAFSLISKGGDGVVSASVLHQLLHRTSIINPPPPSFYSVPVFEQNLVDECLPAEFSSFSLEQLWQEQKSRELLQQCLYYQIKDATQCITKVNR